MVRRLTARADMRDPQEDASVGEGRASEVTRDKSVQIHLRLSPDDAALLRRIAAQRDQTISGAIRYLLRPFRQKAH